MRTVVFEFRRVLAGTIAVLALILSCRAGATPIVTFTAAGVGGGVFRYDLTLGNEAGSEPVSGLIVLHGGTDFVLDNTSVISAPVGWSLSAPLPPVVDPLFYFSLNSSADVPINGSLTGFTFESLRNPATLTDNEFAVAAVGAVSGREILLGNAEPIPEPQMIWLIAFAACAAALVSRIMIKPAVH
jgi:hypothetical protein